MIKHYFLSRIDVAKCCHMATRVHVTWRHMYAVSVCDTCVYVCSRVHACARMCARESD